MPRVRKHLVELLSALSPAEIAKLVAPRLESLRREEEAIRKRLQEVERQIAAIAGTAVVRRRRRRRVGLRRRRLGRPPLGPRVGRPPVRRAKRGSVTANLRAVLEKATQPMRVKEIIAGLVRRGVARKPGLPNYISRLLSTNSAFVRAGRGLYRMAGSAAASARKIVRRKKAMPEPAEK